MLRLDEKGVVDGWRDDVDDVVDLKVGGGWKGVGTIEIKSVGTIGIESVDTIGIKSADTIGIKSGRLLLQ